MPEAIYGLWVGLRLVLGTATLHNARDRQTPTWTSHSLLPVKLDLQMENKEVGLCNRRITTLNNRGGVTTALTIPSTRTNCTCYVTTHMSSCGGEAGQ